MAEPLISPTPEINSELPAGAAEHKIPLPRPERELAPPELYGNPRLTETAEAIGSALGNSACSVREMKDLFTVVRGHGSERISSKMAELRKAADAKIQQATSRAGEIIDNAKRQTTAKVEQGKSRATQLMDNAKETASERLTQARSRAVRFADERPLTILAGVAGVFFLLGAGLRIWRSNRD